MRNHLTLREQIPLARLALAALLAVTLVAGCGKKNDTISQAEKKDTSIGVNAPGIEETKAIAEEGFIYACDSRRLTWYCIWLV